MSDMKSEGDPGGDVEYGRRKHEEWKRNQPPGLRFPPLNVDRCRQLVSHYVQSTAVHSRSQGWLPMVKLDLTHVPLSGPGDPETLELILDPEDVKQFRLVLAMALDRADEDAKRGLLPPEEDT